MSTSVTSTWVVSLCICIVYFCYAFFKRFAFFFSTYIILTSSGTSCGMFFPFISFRNRSTHFKKDVSDFFYIHLTLSTCLHPLHTLGWFPYVIALYTFVTLFRGFLIFFFQHTDLVYICYILWDVFPMYFHCIRSLHFLRAVSNSFLDSARLHPLHILGWFPYVFALYTFVTLFRGFLIFFFTTYRFCIHLLHIKGCFSYIFPLYTFVKLFESCI